MVEQEDNQGLPPPPAGASAGPGATAAATATAAPTPTPPPRAAAAAANPANPSSELELALDAAARVNRHLNGELEAVLLSLRAAEEERAAWEERAHWLARKLADERRGTAQRGRRRNGDGEEEDGDDSGAAAAASALLKEATAASTNTAAAEPPDTATHQAWRSCTPQRRALEAAGRTSGWLARRAEIALGDRLGEGAFGVTYRCTWRGADAVAKHLRPPTTSAEALNFLREVKCLAAVRHPHVVPFLGAVLEEGPQELWLLSEYMPGGSMADWLRGRKGSLSSSSRSPPPAQPYTRPPPLADRLSAALDVARGLAALAAAAPTPIMHRDVKPSNVFIDAGGRARLGDFGLARPYPGYAVATDEAAASSTGAERATTRTDLATGETGTYAYMAPEVVRHEAYDGAKADAWSFGVLLVEAATLERPYEHSFLAPVQIALGVADEKLRPWIPSSLLPPAVAVLAGALCDFDPAMRPDWAFVVAELEQAVRELRRAGKGGGGGGGGGWWGGSAAAGEQQQSTASWLLSRLLGDGLGVPSSWIPILGAAATAAGAGATATAPASATPSAL